MTEQASRLGRMVRVRLAELGISARALTRAGYTPPGAVERLLRGESIPRDLTGVDRGLGWLPNSAREVAFGGDPQVVLAPPGAQPESALQVVVKWPRADKDWRAACEEAWAKVDLEAAATSAGRHSKGDSQGEGSAYDWLEQRLADWPAWLAARTRRILDGTDPSNESVDVFVLADRIMGLQHARDLLRLLLTWVERGKTGEE